MNSILILSYCYPPARYVASQRPFALAKQLAKSGIRVTVVTRDWDPGGDVDYFGKSRHNQDHIVTNSHIRIVKTSFAGVYTIGQRPAGEEQPQFTSLAHQILRKTFVLMSLFIQYFLPIGPYSAIYRGAKRELEQSDLTYDAIVAHGEPFVLFGYAKKLAKRHNIPWVADYRDPWSMDPLASIVFPFRYVFSLIETSLVRTASLVICATEYVARYTPPAKSKSIINNGYDFTDSTSSTCQITGSESILQLVLAGTIQPWDRWQEVVDAVNRYQTQVKLTFIGTNINSTIEEYVRRTYPEAKVVVVERQPHEIVTGMLVQADALLLFNNYAAIGTKVYEYLGAKKHILFCYDSNVTYAEDANAFRQCKLMKGINVDCQQNLIETYKGGTILRDKTHLLQEIDRLIRVKQSKGHIPRTTKNTDELNRASQMQRFVRLIQEICNNRR